MLVQQVRKQQREEQILLSFDILTYATRKQLQIINNLGGERNAQRILQRMEKERFISSIRTEQKIYFLSNKGKERIGSKQGELNKKEIVHTLMRNDLYIKLGMPNTWEKERPIKLNGEVFIIPDARFKKNGEIHFVEIDNKQTMKTNKEKIKKYKELSPIIFKQFNHTPTLIWYTLSEVRRQKLKELCETLNVKYRIYGSM